MSLNPPLPFRDLSDAGSRLRRASQAAASLAHSSKKKALPNITLTVAQADQLAELIEASIRDLSDARATVREASEAPDSVEVL